MRTSLSLVAASLLMAGAFAAGALWSRARRPEAAPVVRGFACPMHPQYRSDRPGDCPACGMRLEPESRGTGEERARRPGTIAVSAERQQAIGVRLGVAERTGGTRTLRTTGRVAPDEDATYPIVAGANGWIRSVGRATTGTRVRKDQILASFYSPEFASAQQAYFSGLDTLGRVEDGQLQAFNQRRVVEGVQRFADTLRNMGVSETQLAEMVRARSLAQDVQLRSPVDGFVLQRNASVGLRFDRGFELYRIADLRHVWVLADVYQQQLPFLRAGARALVTSAQLDAPFPATVSRAEPVFDEATLTLKLRLEAPNPGERLKPGMFVDVELPIELPPALAVPADAIVDSGARKTVYVDRGDGTFEPRLVETGWRIGDRVEIVRGLMEGERIVLSATFLVDSESRMKAAAQGIVGAGAVDPVCGMDVDAAKALAAGRRSAHDGAEYFFCADGCKREFDARPARYARRSPGPGARTHDTMAKDDPGAPATDPICHMQVDARAAEAAGRVSERHGQRHYFCSDSCKERFAAGAEAAR